MAEPFLSLSAKDRRDALGVAADRSGRPAHLLEKDVWVVWALQTIFGSELGTHLVFKGGTSLSKAYGIIHRFSEDVDLTYDIRAIAPDLVRDNDEALPATRSEEKRWSKVVRQRLPEWVSGTVRPLLIDAIEAQGVSAVTRVEGEKLFIDYEATSAGSGYVAPSVLLEFGARSTGEPASPRNVVCDAAGLLDGVTFPTASPRVMHAERTFGKRRQRSTSSACRNGFEGSGSHAIGTMWSGWMTPGSRPPPLPTETWPLRSRSTRACSSRRRMRMAQLSTMGRPSPESCGSSRAAKRAQHWPQTMRGWSKTGCCLRTQSPSRR